ncbi:AGAP011225-PA-like protein [Anopheles sinensis]|uniref:AGAP011225-PA-like protein n=1 Tax=Anopheles sinensis TaxID=74873 RepID=A0A084VGQ8_ANOSI|nr:AGAP011225-PA-like protein [Anopheles sinensis]
MPTSALIHTTGLHQAVQNQDDQLVRVQSCVVSHCGQSCFNMCSNVRVAIHCYRFVLLLLTTVVCSGANYTDSSFGGYGFEVMMAKLDYLQYKLQEMELAQKERDEEFSEKFTKLEDSFETNSRKILAQQTTCANHERMRNEIEELTQKLNRSNQYMAQSELATRRKGPLKSCKEASLNVSGVYLIRANEDAYPFDAFCEQNTFGGGWLVIQYRFDGSLDFYRNWTEYQKGFGNLNHEFWLGLERLYQLTSQGRYELLVELKGFKGAYRYAQYDEFAIGNESEQYPLKKLGTFSGTAADALSRHKDMKFSTHDRDNDASNENCAVERHGAWWYVDCADSNLNGKYMNKNDHYSMHWVKGSSQGWAYSRMMIRKM